MDQAGRSGYANCRGFIRVEAGIDHHLSWSDAGCAGGLAGGGAENRVVSSLPAGGDLSIPSCSPSCAAVQFRDGSVSCTGNLGPWLIGGQSGRSGASGTFNSPGGKVGGAGHFDGSLPRPTVGVGASLCMVSSVAGVVHELVSTSSPGRHFAADGIGPPHTDANVSRSVILQHLWRRCIQRAVGQDQTAHSEFNVVSNSG
jgi:hypothetical protein